MTEREYTPQFLTEMPLNGIFVFGSNAGGYHGKGAARLAKDNFGAVYGQARGLQGRSYAIVTKKNWRVEKSSTLAEIAAELYQFFVFAASKSHLKFYVTKLGSSLAGYTVEEIANLFKGLKVYITDNVILPKEYECR